jgi:hypothetical protein
LAVVEQHSHPQVQGSAALVTSVIVLQPHWHPCSLTVVSPFDVGSSSQLDEAASALPPVAVGAGQVLVEHLLDVVAEALEGGHLLGELRHPCLQQPLGPPAGAQPPLTDLEQFTDLLETEPERWARLMKRTRSAASSPYSR